jgi:hypothetical protein
MKRFSSVIALGFNCKNISPAKQVIPEPLFNKIVPFLTFAYNYLSAFRQ